MVTIKVGFSKPKVWKPFAWLIMAGYDIPYDHVYIELYSTKYDRKMIYQASGSKVNFMGHDLFYADNVSIAEYTVDLADDKYVEMMQFAIDTCGKPYGVKQCFGMAIVRIAEIFGRKWKNPFRDGDQTFVCSEMGAYVLENFAGVTFNTDIDDITPRMVYDYFQTLASTKLSSTPNS